MTDTHFLRAMAARGIDAQTAAFTALSLAGAAVFLRHTGVYLDDAYVYFRIVETLIATGRPVFNADDGFILATSPLWLMLLTAGKLVLPWLDLPRIAELGFVLLLLVASGALFALLRGRMPVLAVLAPVPVFFTPYLPTLAGHDTALALATGLLLCLAFMRRSALFPLAAALFYLARGEGAILAILLGAVLLVEAVIQRRLWAFILQMLPAALAGLVLVAGWHLWHAHLFGTLLPSTMATKQLQGDSGWTTFTAAWRNHVGRFVDPSPTGIVTGLLALLGWGALLRHVWPLAVWPLLHFGVYAGLGVAYYHWYYYSIDFALALCVVAGVAVAARVLAGALDDRARVRTALIAVAVALAVPVLIAPVRTAVTGIYDDPRFRLYARIVDAIQARSDGAVTLLSHEIGIFGYLLPQAAVRDVVGLATPVTRKEELWDWESRAREFRPDFIAWPFERSALRIHGADGPDWLVYAEAPVPGTQGMTLYARVDDVADLTAAQRREVAAAQAIWPVPGLNGLIPVGDRLALYAHAPSRFTLEVPTDAEALDIGFGFLPGAWEAGRATDGARFSIARADAPDSPVWSSMVDPVDNPADRATAYARLPVTGGERLILSVDPGGSASWDWTFWTMPRFGTSGDLAGPCPVSVEAVAEAADAGFVDALSWSADGLTLRGWAIDRVAGQPAAAAVVTVDDRVAACLVPQAPRDDVAAAMKSAAVRHAGFAGTIAVPGGGESSRVRIYAKRWDGTLVPLVLP